MRRRAAGCLAIAVAAAALALVIGVGVLVVALNRGTPVVLPEAERCVATAAGSSVSVDLDQAHYAAVIAGVAVRRGLPARAVSIALATAYQESGIRNLDHGDRDSIGLFQQRPSQGWGTRRQIMDPHYSAGKFYDALVKVRNWQRGDITEVAQKVQRSGYPEAYRDHEADAKVLASVLTGQSPAGLSCVDRTAPNGPAGDAALLRAGVAKDLGITRVAVNGAAAVYRGRSAAQAWTIAQHVVANSGRYGVAVVTVGDQEWRHDPDRLAPWATLAEPQVARTDVSVTLR